MGRLTFSRKYYKYHLRNSGRNWVEAWNKCLKFPESTQNLVVIIIIIIIQRALTKSKGENKNIFLTLLGKKKTKKENFFFVRNIFLPETNKKKIFTAPAANK